jgi:hypothetical protein
MTRPADEVALYEAVFGSQPAGSADQFAVDRHRIAKWVDRLRRSGWHLVYGGTQEPEWLNRLNEARAAAEGEVSLDEFVAGLLDVWEKFDPEADPEERIRELEDLLERNDIQVPE